MIELVESLEQRVFLSGGHGHRVKNYSPVTIAGDSIRCNVKHGAGLFAARGHYSILFTGAGTYQLFAGPGIVDSFGTYGYSKTGNLTASATLNDSNVGLVSTEVLTFKSAHSGNFLVTAADGSFQSGTFSF
jgi:hypothetical protein